MQEYFYYFLPIVRFSFLIPILVGAYFKIGNKSPINIIYFYICLGFATEIGANVIKASGSNLIVYNSFTFLSFILLSFFFISVIKGEAIQRIVKPLVIVSSLGVLISYVWSFFPITIMTSALTYSNFFFVLMIVIYLYELLQKIGKVRVENLPFFWISIGLLVYYAGNSVVYLSYNFLSRSELKSVWIIPFITVVIRNIFIAIGFYIFWKQQKSRNL